LERVGRFDYFPKRTYGRLTGGAGVQNQGAVRLLSESFQRKISIVRHLHTEPAYTEFLEEDLLDLWM